MQNDRHDNSVFKTSRSNNINREKDQKIRNVFFLSLFFFISFSVVAVLLGVVINLKLFCSMDTLANYEVPFPETPR